MSQAATTTTPPAAPGTTVVRADNLRQVYTIKKGMLRKPDQLQAVSGVSFSVQAGKTLAIVGESGCGKSTLARMVALIESPSAGSLQLGGIDVMNASAHDKRALRQKVQLVFQNPYGSLNPRKRIGQILEARQSPRHACTGWVASRTLRPLPPHVFRWSAPTHCHCAGADAQPLAGCG